MIFGENVQEQQPTKEALAALMNATPSEAAGRALREWARDVWNRALRGDLIAGILSLEAVEAVPEALRRAAEWGVADAWLDLGRWLTDPPESYADYDEADAALKRAVEAGVPGAQQQLVELRWFHRRDEVSDVEEEEAYALLQGLLEENPQNDRALYLLALLTSQGFGTEADPAAAVALQERAAAMGNTDAMFELYIHYATGAGVPQDNDRAFEVIGRAAEAGHPRAMYNMGAFYAIGHLTMPLDPAKAAEWYQRAADAGVPRAAVNLAMMYATGQGVEQDADRAEALFEQAEDMGFDTEVFRDSVGMGEEEDDE